MYASDRIRRSLESSPSTANAEPGPLSNERRAQSLACPEVVWCQLANPCGGLLVSDVHSWLYLVFFDSEIIRTNRPFARLDLLSLGAGTRGEYSYDVPGIRAHGRPRLVSVRIVCSIGRDL